MRTKQKSTFFLSLAMMFLFAAGVSSCKKKCQLEAEDRDSGVIITEAVVYPSSGGLLGSLSGNYHIHGGSSYASTFEMRLNPDSDRIAVNYGNYSILANPVTVNCNVAFERSVTVDNTTQTAVYHVRATQCRDAKCDEKRVAENWVLVPAIPSNYSIYFTHEIVEK